MTSPVAASPPKVTSSRGRNHAISQQAFGLGDGDDDEDDGDGGDGDEDGDGGDNDALRSHA